MFWWFLVAVWSQPSSSSHWCPCRQTTGVENHFNQHSNDPLTTNKHTILTSDLVVLSLKTVQTFLTFTVWVWLFVFLWMPFSVEYLISVQIQSWTVVLSVSMAAVSITFSLRGLVIRQERLTECSCVAENWVVRCVCGYECVRLWRPPKISRCSEPNFCLPVHQYSLPASLNLSCWTAQADLLCV